MVAAAADDGAAPAVVEASAKLLASPEVDELEAAYTKWGWCLVAGLLGENEGNIHRVGPKNWAMHLIGISSQTSGSTCELWATPVHLR
jgi:hypothetical protein